MKKSIRYFTTRPGRDGRSRFFWQPTKALAREGWKLTRLNDNQHEAIGQAEAINAQLDEWRAGRRDTPSTILSGTLDALIADYKQSASYKDLGHRTRPDYDRHLKAISQWAGDKPATMIDGRMVSDLYEEIRRHSSRQADYLIQVLRLVFYFGEKRGLIPRGTNPAARPDLQYRAPKGTLWSPEAVRAFVIAADKAGYYSIGTAVMLNEWIGQRKGDIITLPETAYVNGVITIGAQSKTGNEVPPLDLNTVAPALVARLDEQLRRNRARARPGTTLIQQEDGKSFIETHFTEKVRTIRMNAQADEPSLKGMIFKNLRHTAITRLAEAGCTPQEIAAISGHTLKSVEVIIDRYNIRTQKMARNALEKRAAAEKV